MVTLFNSLSLWEFIHDHEVLLCLLARLDENAVLTGHHNNYNTTN